MRKCSRAFLMILAAFTVLGSTPPSDETNQPVYSEVRPGSIMVYAGGTATAIPVEGAVLHVSSGDGGVYYLVDGGEGKGLRVGFAGGDPMGKLFEKNLPESVAPGHARAFHAGTMIARILIMETPEDTTGSLYRIDLNDMRIIGEAVPDVADFLLEGEDELLLIRRESGLFLTMGGRSVPVSLARDERCTLKAFLDRRVAVVTDGEAAELIDIVAERSLYQYQTGRDFMPPEEFNFEITVFDDMESESIAREMLFYKVFIDGVESGRTDTGPAGLERSFKTLLETDRWHLVTLERWVLNQARGRYERANNVLQPKIQRVYMPMNRIIGMRVRFDGNEYHVTAMPKFK
ncbi:MAG: hypothetical protein JW838_13885 [Spirochaetes bacterium]|nr:hypothetical protein [Spirochaetota bacterium]